MHKARISIETPNPDLYIRLATPADRPRLISLINSAFAIETFLEGTRTDDQRLTAMMEKGEILLAENSSGQILACVYAVYMYTVLRLRMTQEFNRIVPELPDLVRRLLGVYRPEV